jgi:hypothetical protein
MENNGVAFPGEVGIVVYSVEFVHQINGQS